MLTPAQYEALLVEGLTSLQLADMILQSDFPIIDHSRAQRVALRILDADPVAVRTKFKKTPFVKDIFRWLINYTIRLPEDTEDIRQVLSAYQKARHEQGFERDISEFNSPGQIAEELDIYNADDSIDKWEQLGLELEAEHDAFYEGYKMYRIDTWEQGKEAFVNSGWCVRHYSYFRDYATKGSFYMVVKDNGKRVALFHPATKQLMDVYDNPIEDETITTKVGPRPASEVLAPFIRKIMTVEQYNPYNRDTMDFASEVWGTLFDDHIVHSPIGAYHYADTYLKDRGDFLRGYPEGEDAIAKNPHFAYDYAKNILRGRFLKGEPVIAKSSHALDYIINILKRRWPEGEDTILKWPSCIYIYAKRIIKGRWPKGERQYAKIIQSGRIPEHEDENFVDVIMPTSASSRSRIEGWIAYAAQYSKEFLDGDAFWIEDQDLRKYFNQINPIYRHGYATPEQLNALNPNSVVHTTLGARFRAQQREQEGEEEL